jgi:hypothetical protein
MICARYYRVKALDLVGYGLRPYPAERLKHGLILEALRRDTASCVSTRSEVLDLTGYGLRPYPCGTI